MNWRKTVGWLLFALGFILAFIVLGVRKEITGNFALDIFIAVLGMGVAGAGWSLAHTKKKE